MRSLDFVFLALPMIAGVAVFTLLPAIIGVGLSLYRWELVAHPEWVGFSNYRYLFQDTLFQKAIINTFFFALLVPVKILFSYCLAMLLSGRSLRNQSLRLAAFLPTLVNPIAIFILWRWIYQADVGLIARLGAAFGVEFPMWLEDPTWAKPALMIVMLWEGIGGFSMLFFLAAFRQIPKQVHEMSYLDGASGLQKFAVVYWPWTRRVIWFSLALGYLGALYGGFEIAYAMTGGGPLHATTTLSFYAFETAFQMRHAGYAAAIGVTMMLAAVPLIILRVLLTKTFRSAAS